MRASVVLTAGAAVVLAAVLAVATPPAFAKAAAGMKSAEEVLNKAITDEAERIARERDAKRDLVQELIDGFKDKAKGVPLTEWTKLTEIINDSKDAKKEPYRRAAADALIKRFAAENSTGEAGAAVRTVRRDCAMDIVDLMKAQKDETGLACADAVLGEWYKRELTNYSWKLTAKPDDRRKVWSKFKNWLKSSD